MEQRREERRNEDRFTRISLVQANSYVIGKTRNVSVSGARVELHQALSPGTEVKLDLVADEYLLEVRARVVHCEQLNEDCYSIGLQFLGMDDRDIEQLQKFVHAKPHIAGTARNGDG